MFIAMFNLIVIIAVIISSSEQQKCDDLLVEIGSGELRGSYMKSEGGRTFYSYRGIPYAEAPLKQLRFKPPVPKVKWEGIFDATHDGVQCLQFSLMLQQLIGDEDCLLLNVYSPLSPADRIPSKLLPVIVFIHGGAFIMGSGLSTELGPEKMMDYNVVVVTFNYRINVMGFLSTTDEASPGNYAMLDQVLLLKWVRDNIKAFGGDPNRVTLSGTSAGAWAVMLHLVSPLSKGLFHAAISQSGSPFSNWGNVYSLKKSVEITAPLLNCQENDSKAIIDCIRRRSAVEIVQKNFFIEDFCDLVTNVRHHAGKDAVRGSEAFLPDYAPVLFQRGAVTNEVPLFIGVTSHDGSFISDSCGVKYNSFGSDHLQNWLPLMLQKMLGANYEDSLLLQENIINEYFTRTLQDENEISRKLTRIYSDFAFDYTVDEIAETFSKKGIPVFVYRFTHSKGPFDFLGMNMTFEYKEHDHVSHGEDLTYIFNTHKSPQMIEWYNFDDKDKKVSKLLLDLWTSFARDLIPSSNMMSFSWKASTAAEPVYLQICAEPSLVFDKLCRHKDFWIDNIKQLNAQLS